MTDQASDLGEGQHREREIGAAKTKEDEAERDTDDRREASRQEHRQKRVERSLLKEQREGVGRYPEESGVAKRNLSGVAAEQVEAETAQGREHHDDCQIQDVVAVFRGGPKRHRCGEENQQAE